MDTATDHSPDGKGLVTAPAMSDRLARDKADNANLARRTGKKAVLRRNFGFMTIVGFSCTVLITWEGTVTVFLTGLQNGGPAGLVYGFILVWLGTLSTFVTLSELVSMAPTSGGQYHWVSMLAPRRWRRFLSYVTGWLTLAGWQSLVASGGFVCGTMVQGLVVLTHPEYLESMQNWHGTLLYWAVILWAFVINTALGSLLVRFEGFVLVLHLLGFFAVLLPMVVLSPEHASSEQVFTLFVNKGGWPTQGLSFCVGLSGSVFAFLGGDGAIHMAEEIQNPELVVPRSLMTSLLVNGTLGLAMLIGTLYSLGDVEAALAANPAYPFMAVFSAAVGSAAGAAVMSGIILSMSIGATTGIMASASRMYWAFSRDAGLPASAWLRRVSGRTGVPLNAVTTVAVVAVLLSLVNIGDAAAFNGVISISIAGLFGSYLVAAALLLYRRLDSSISEPRGSGQEVEMDDGGGGGGGGGAMVDVDAGLVWGPWRLPAALGVANNLFTCAYLVLIEFFILWPSNKDPTPQNMNWAVVPFGAVTCFSMLYYYFWASNVYTGPVVEL